MKPKETEIKKSAVQERLHKIAENDPTIRGFVAKQAQLSSYENTVCFFRDLLNNGCASGMIDTLIYYHDTHAFYDHYYSEIEALREGWEDQIGEPMRIRGDLKNHLAWFAFERAAHELAAELELNI